MNSEEICNIIQKEAKVEEKQKTITREKYEYLGNEFMNIIYKKNTNVKARKVELFASFPQRMWYTCYEIMYPHRVRHEI